MGRRPSGVVERDGRKRLHAEDKREGRSPGVGGGEGRRGWAVNSRFKGKMTSIKVYERNDRKKGG